MIRPKAVTTEQRKQEADVRGSQDQLRPDCSGDQVSWLKKVMVEEEASKMESNGQSCTSPRSLLFAIVSTSSAYTPRSSPKERLATAHGRQLADLCCVKCGSRGVRRGAIALYRSEGADTVGGRSRATEERQNGVSEVADPRRYGEFHLGYSRSELQGISWYQLLHWESTREAQSKHRLITQSEQDRSCILLVRMQRRQNDFIWVHVVLQVRDGQDSNQQSVIVCTNQVLSDREASVMLSNSWLYHYYTVQSKMQFGIPFEGATRIPASTSYYHGEGGGHHSPISAAGVGVGAAGHHGYIAPPHHVSYGYHSPVGQAGGGGGGHHNGTSGHFHHGLTAGVGGEHYRPYAYKLDPGQPVDYSGQIRCESTGSSQSVQPDRNGTPPVKKRAINRLEPLYIPENGQDSPESSITELHPPGHASVNHPEHPDGGVGAHSGIPIQPISGGSVQTMTLSTSLHTRSNRQLLKGPPSATITAAEPTDFIDQWNPSPPWSDTTVQKVPDITHQELSPYMTTTPPTPTSAPPHYLTSGVPTTFSFDWMPEQFVPIMSDCSIAGSSAFSGPLPCTQDGLPVPAMSLPMPVPMQIPPPPWPSDHRLLALDSSGASSSSSGDRKPPEEQHLHPQQQGSSGELREYKRSH